MAASLAHSIQHRERVGGFRHEQRGLHPAHLSRLTLSQVLNGHNGCVNALNWNRDGSLLASGSDDLHVCVHKFSTAGVSPLLARIPTGHRGNIFSVKFLGDTNDTIACCARDGHVRILDLNIATKDGALRSVYTCHKDAVKRIVTDPRSDSVFLSCSEDGTVRQFDLRVPHQCNHAQQICPPPLVDYSSNSELTALSLNRINPNYFAIGGTDPQVLVHDRRMPSRAVRKFHQPAEETGYARRRTDSHVTAVQFAQTNGRELLGSWGSGYVQLFDFERDELEQEAREKQRAMRRVWLGNSDTASLGALDQIISQVREHFVAAQKSFNDGDMRGSLAALLRVIRETQVGAKRGSLTNLSPVSDPNRQKQDELLLNQILEMLQRDVARCSLRLVASSLPDVFQNSRYKTKKRRKVAKYQIAAKDRTDSKLEEGDADISQARGTDEDLSGGSSSQTLPVSPSDLPHSYIQTIERAMERLAIQLNNEDSLPQTSLLWAVCMWGKAVISDQEKVEDTIFDELGKLVGRLRALAKSRTDGLSAIMSCTDGIERYLNVRSGISLALDEPDEGDSKSEDRDGGGQSWGSGSKTVKKSRPHETDENEDDELNVVDDIGPDAGGAIALAAWRSYISHFVTYLECSKVTEVHSSWDDARGDSSDENENEDDGSDSGDDEEEGYDHDTSSTNERNLSEKRRQAVNICYPRRRFVGHCNVMTTKDVTFLGARDEYVASGSDDGSLIIFDKFTGRVLQVLRADGEVCNVIQAHPSYPVLAASGIDDTIKIFEPVFPIDSKRLLMNPPPPLRAWLNDEQHESTGDEEDFVPEMHDLEVMREAVNGRWRGIDAERMLFPPGTSTSDRARRQGRQMPRAYSDGLGTSRRNNPSLTRAFPSSLILDNEGLNFDRPSGRRRSGDRVAEQQLVGTQLGEGLMIPSSLMPQVAHVLHENEERRAEQRNRPLLTRRALFAWLSRFSAADGEISTGEEGDAEEDEGTDGEQPGPGCELQ